MLTTAKASKRQAGRDNGAARALMPAALAVVALVGLCAFVSTTRTLDLEVYRVGGRTWLEGLHLYASAFPAPLDGPALPFTYPPIAAVLFSPLALVPLPLASGLVTAATVVSVAAVVSVAWRATGRRPFTPVQFAGVILVVCIGVEPVRSTLEFGQVNALLMVLVVVDCLVMPPRWRGVLVGVAASVKLIPLGFLLYFVAQRDWRACVRGLTAFAAMTGLALVLARADSWAFWTSVLLDPARIGNPGWITNQSLAGVLAREVATGSVATLVWAVAAAVLAVVTWWIARALLGQGLQLQALVVVATWCLLVSPVSWSHHWVWVVPGFIALLDPRLGHLRWRAAAGGGLTVVFVAAPLSWGPFMTNDKVSFSLSQSVYGNAYAVSGLAVLLAEALWALRTVEHTVTARQS